MTLEHEESLFLRDVSVGLYISTPNTQSLAEALLPERHCDEPALTMGKRLDRGTSVMLGSGMLVRNHPQVALCDPKAQLLSMVAWHH